MHYAGFAEIAQQRGAAEHCCLPQKTSSGNDFRRHIVTRSCASDFALGRLPVPYPVHSSPSSGYLPQIERDCCSPLLGWTGIRPHSLPCQQAPLLIWREFQADLLGGWQILLRLAFHYPRYECRKLEGKVFWHKFSELDRSRSPSSPSVLFSGSSRVYLTCSPRSVENNTLRPFANDIPCRQILAEVLVPRRNTCHTRSRRMLSAQVMAREWSAL